MDGTVHCSIKDNGKCSKILNIFFFLFSNKMFVFKAGIHKKLFRIANREDSAQTVPETVWSGSVLIV